MLSKDYVSSINYTYDFEVLYLVLCQPTTKGGIFFILLFRFDGFVDIALSDIVFDRWTITTVFNTNPEFKSVYCHFSFVN